MNKKMTTPWLINRFKTNPRTFGAWAWAAIFFFKINLLVAQGAVTFEAAIGVKEVVVGVPFELTFTLKNAEGTRFTPPVFSGLSTGKVSEMRGMGFENGRSSSSQSWSVVLTASKAGTYAIGAATVSAAGRTLSTKPLTVKALPLSASSKGNVTVPSGADDKVFVAASFDPNEVTVGQQLTWRIRLYTQFSVEGYDIISLPDFEGFFSKEKLRYDKRVEYLKLKGKKYAVRTLHEEALFPQEAGELSVDAAKLTVGIEQPGPQGFLFGPKPVALQTIPASIKVNALQQPRLPEFTGGVGRYEWTVTADTSKLTTDDALTLLVEVKGNGDTRRFAPPKITVPSSCEIFDPRILEEEEYESETGILHRKKYEYIVLPKDTGTLEINPVLAYFDTDSNRYCLLRTAPIRFAVTPGKNYQPPGNLTDPLPREPTIEQRPSLLEKGAVWLRSPIVWGILALPFLALGIFVLLKKMKSERLPTEAVVPAGKQAFQHAEPWKAGAKEGKHTDLPATSQTVSQYPNIQISTAATRERFANAHRLLDNGVPLAFYAELFKALQAWLAAQLGLQPSQMNEAELSAILLQRGATPIRIQALLSVWHTCEQAVYGGQTQVEQMVPTCQMAEQVVEALEREIRQTPPHA